MQRGRCGFESHRLHLRAGRSAGKPESGATEEKAGSRPGPAPARIRLRSVNGKHAPFVRPRCGFDSCRGLHFRTPVAQRKERWSATPGAAGSTPAGRAQCGCGSAGRSPGRPPRRGRSDPGRPLDRSRARGVTGARRAPTSPVRVRILASLPFIDRRGPERLGYLMASGAERSARAVRNRYPTALHDRGLLPSAAGRRRRRYRLLIDRSQVRLLPGASLSCPGSSAAEQFGRHPTTAAATFFGRGPERIDYLHQGRSGWLESLRPPSRRLPAPILRPRPQASVLPRAGSRWFSGRAPGASREVAGFDACPRLSPRAG